VSTPNRKQILVTGATGYVGGRLVNSLLSNNLDVKIFVRDINKTKSHSWTEKVNIATGNALNYNETLTALTGVHTAFYLLHSINLGSDFDKIEARMARNFAKAALAAGVKQIVYLGGINNDTKTSTHLKSRANTGAILASTSVPVLEIRAGIILGSGSASFEMLRHLTHRLPIMTTPKWVMNKTHPISIRDVLWYLTKAAQLKKPINGIYDMGGPEILTYADMMQKFAKISGLRKRIIIKVPVLTPKLSSLWIGFVTPVPPKLARPLVNSLISEVVVDPKKSISKIIKEPPEGLISVTQAIKYALGHTSKNTIATHWSDASTYPYPWQKAQSDPEWAGEAIYKDIRIGFTSASNKNLWKTIEKIGGNNGYYGTDLFWKLRGAMDKTIGGVGLRRGRRDPNNLKVGDSLDFWRVESIQPNKSLKLYAEMILPGKAWLELNIKEKNNNRNELTIEASFAPRGIGGHLYWWSVKPFHNLIFPIMLKNIISSSKQRDRREKNASI
jgi:uncharacterized protein YbjT (DUF2867 family)